MHDQMECLHQTTPSMLSLRIWYQSLPFCMVVPRCHWLSCEQYHPSQLYTFRESYNDLPQNLSPQSCIVVSSVCFSSNGSFESIILLSSILKNKMVPGTISSSLQIATGMQTTFVGLLLLP